MSTKIPPLLEDTRHAYHQICAKFRQWYGVQDAEAFYAAWRQRILDRCEPDEFGIAKYETLRDYWEAKQLAARYGVTA